MTLQERLRDPFRPDVEHCTERMLRAADELDRLQAENETLRKALKIIMA